jgi:3alpha(or 20beta)-hydroxysteroid dehydrogenase
VAYGATKWALRGMTKTAAIEFGGPGGIRVNSIHPGAVDTPMIAAMASHNEHAFDRFPVPRVAQPEEIAAMITYLASTESSYVTGAEFVIDGGLTAGPPLFDPNEV